MMEEESWRAHLRILTPLSESADDTTLMPESEEEPLDESERGE